MADYRLSAKIIGRSSGRSSVAAAAYRAGAELHDDRTGLSHDYTRKGGVLHSEIMAPENAPDWMKDRAKLWNAVEAVERRKDAQLAREIQLSLPHELDESQNRKMLFRFIQSHFVDRGMIADVAIHAPDRGGDQRNVHAHVMLTTRVLTADGFGKKNREWNTPEQLTDWRKSWAEHQNSVFQELGMEQRVDHRSYADQGVDREPTQHLGPVANDMEKNGKASRIGEENRARQARNAERAALAQESANTARELAAEKTKQAERVNAQKAAMQSHMLDEDIALRRRQTTQESRLDADLERRNSERRAFLEDQQRALEEQLKASGWRKLMRDLLGKTRRDSEQLEATRKNIHDMQMREAEERAALQLRQQSEQNALNLQRTSRETAYALRLEEERRTALERASGAKDRVPPPQPANDKQPASWSRPHAPEQDNRGKGPEDFRKAATGPAMERQAQSDRQRAIEQHKAQIRERLQADREQRDRGFERD